MKPEFQIANAPAGLIALMPMVALHYGPYFVQLECGWIKWGFIIGLSWYLSGPPDPDEE